VNSFKTFKKKLCLNSNISENNKFIYIVEVMKKFSINIKTDNNKENARYEILGKFCYRALRKKSFFRAVNLFLNWLILKN
jgi:hypothetical protein